MKSVMLSIQPKWVEKIVNGEKTIEVRKSRPEIETPFKCYIYMSKGDLKYLGSYSEWIYKNRMKVVGEFICDKVFLLHPYSYDGGNADLGHSKFIQTFDGPSKVIEILSATCLSQNEMFDYIGEGNYGYGWHISDLKIYDKPKELSEFNRPCPIENKDCENCIRYDKPYTWDFDEKNGTIYCTRRLTRPPQSYMYVEEVKQ